MNKLKFYLRNRFLVAIIYLGLFIVINMFFTGSLLPSADTMNFWFYSGLLLLLFSILFIEPFYTSPKNIITNLLALAVSYIAIKNSFSNSFWWTITFSFIVLCLFLAIVSISIQSNEKSEDSLTNVIALKLRFYLGIVARGKIIYSVVFLSVIFLYKQELVNQFSDHYFISMIVMYVLILNIKPESLHSKFVLSTNKSDKESIGEVFSVQSENMFLIRLFDDKTDVKKFDLVMFKYLLDDSANNLHKGIVFDSFKLNSQKWVKVLSLISTQSSDLKLSKNLIYKVTSDKELRELNEILEINKFVGVVSEDTTIGTIRFEYSKKNNNLQEGDLLQIYVQEKLVYFQVLGGKTDTEKLTIRNESGFTIGEAKQLGIWKNEDMSFEKHGWLPEMNTPIFLANTDNIEIGEIELPDYKIGVIPNTSLPSVINLNEVVSHHTALLGVTGSGKTFIAREIIKELINNTNVICIDFTGEYKKELEELNPVDIIDPEGLPDLEKMLAEKHGKSAAEELKLKRAILAKLDEHVKKYIEGDKNLGLFEIPELSNTSFILEFTQFFIEAVFNYCKKHEEAKVCLVLEEAHTIVPETNFLGDLGDYGSSKALVNKMAQIALQGRKYNVGLIVIAQRTANVSKTVLTQCNTVICFQAFDDTSFNFLGNYLGKDMVAVLPNLKKYHAIVSGKAAKSKIPMIVNLERK